MIDIKKVRLMTRISLYENSQGKKDIKMNRSRQSTYVTLKVIESVLCITVAFVLCAGLYSMRYFSEIVTEGLAAFRETAIHLLIIYLVILVFGLFMTFFYYRDKYRKAHGRIVAYDKDLARLESYMDNGSGKPEYSSLAEEDEEL